jgi:hypothetical protein
VCQHRPILASIDKTSSRESRSNFSTRTHPILYSMSKNMFWCFLNFFIPVKNIAPTCANIGQKSCFRAFELFYSGEKHRTDVGQYWPTLALIVESSPRETRSNFSTRTHPIHSNMSKNHVSVLFGLFHSGEKQCTHVWQYIPTLALIDKSWLRESRSDFTTRTHPILYSMSKNMFWCFLNFFILVKYIAPMCGNISQYWHQ